MPKSHVSRFDPPKFQADILNWYAKNQRVLPWRERGAKKPDPYRVWLSEVMLQQTTVPAVIPYFEKFTKNWPDVNSLAKAQDAEVMVAWAGLGYYARARNLLKCARTVAKDWGGKFPNDIESLQALAGIGPYTAAAIAAIAYGQGATVVDGNIERIVARVFAVSEPFPKGKKDVREVANSIFDNIESFGKQQVRAFPQALMDIGAGICTPKSPNCKICPVKAFCKAFHAGSPETYPVRQAKKTVPTRKGRVYWIEDKAGNIIVENRSPNRMLGGMLGLPSSDWDKSKQEFDGSHIPFVRKIRGLIHIGTVYHVFTHFKLECEVWKVAVPDVEFMIDSKNSGFALLNLANHQIDKIGLPTVFLKAAKLAFKGIKSQ